MSNDRLTATAETAPPVAKKVPHDRVHHGDLVVDDYEWLRDKTDPEVIAHLEAENAYTEARTAHLAEMRQTIFSEIKSRTLETDLSVPVRRGEWWYYARTIEGQQYGLNCRCAVQSLDDWEPPVLEPGTDVPGEQILLDANVEAEGHDFFSLGSFAVTEDGNLLAYAVDTTGDERYLLRIKDLRTGEMLGDEIPNTFPGALWDPSGEFLYYQTVDDAWRPDTVWRHTLGTSASDDVVIFREEDERYWVGMGLTRSRKYLVIEVGSKITSEARVLDASDPTGEFSVVLPRREGVEYGIDHVVVGGEDRFLILHNDGAENFELCEAPVASPERQRVLIEHRDQVRLEGVEVFRDHLVVAYRRDAISRLAIWPIGADGYGELSEIDFGEELYTAGTAANPEWSSPYLRLVFTSFITPGRVFDYDFSSGALHLRKEQPVLGGYSAEEYVQHRDWAVAEDGTRIPISVIRRKDVSTPAPSLLYGYGSYESSVDPTFSVSRLSLLDRGMVFVVAHIRGGGEMGRRWYEDGKTLAKKNTFTDFIACARHLRESGLASIVIADGGSAGGLLMGAVANMAPEQFDAILANVPFVDPLTSILDPSLPLTVIEWDEWGNPLEDKSVYEYMKSYSPYENVESRSYPPILAITSINDTRVLYVEPAKWVARLRDAGARDVLLKTEMSAGHGGVSGRYEKWKEVAFEYAWVLDRAGLIGQG
ncbi:S9 family peptidase [Hoyosella altamirensis]|uniref:Oligopeptidase B n=1 Tax=Hoyosella altamirensis TaxID=616997 RepID=A0A839RNA5_9ACTN|nr:S9 family peptidase [Hoyosella altamirensis]MBB3037411.1 oligopeptidase B [Hoyosella altamirensis]